MLPDLPLPMRSPAKRIRAIVAFAAWIALVLNVAPAVAEVAAKVTWQMTTEYPENNISGIGLATFASRVSERTHGFVTVTNAFDNKLKINSGEMPRAALDGRIAGGDAFAGALSGVDPVLGLSTLPFLAQSVELARATYLRARPLYEKALAARGLKLLYLTIWPATACGRSARSRASTICRRSICGPMTPIPARSCARPAPMRSSCRWTPRSQD